MWAINLASVYIYIWQKEENVLQYLLRMMNFQTIGQWNLHNVIDVFSDVSKQTSFVKCNIKEEKSRICSWIGRKDSGKSYHERKHDVEFRNEFRILFLALLMHLCMCVIWQNENDTLVLFSYNWHYTKDSRNFQIWI